MSRPHRHESHFWTAQFFLLPNILGVLAFVVFPVVFSVVLAFSNWDLRLHNMFHDEPLRFVGLDNFVRLIMEENFFRYLGYTLFLMMVIPLNVAGALLAAMLLGKETRGGGGSVYRWLMASVVLVSLSILLMLVGMGASAMTIMLGGLACGILLMGTLGGQTVYRTLFYMPYFTSGVATFLLWKNMYDPYEGPINHALRPVLRVASAAVNAAPAPVVQAGTLVAMGGMLLLFAAATQKLHRLWSDGDLGTRAALLPWVLLVLPAATAIFWSYTAAVGAWLAAAVVIIGAWHGMKMVRAGRMFTCRSSEGMGTGLMLGMVGMTGQFVLLGLAPLFYYLPDMAADGGLNPPMWIHDYNWAKPSLMLMMLWAAIGSNNMLLYLAALTNIPQDLYEAADIDGAGRFGRFWHVTWPQLAPTTFFIAVMSTIAGLQGGFEMARVMTEGGPAGSTTTLSYFIYIEGFETGRLSFAAAISWALFLLVFLLTVFNWKFGNQYVNE